MGKRYIIQYCTKCTAEDGEENFEYLECVDDNGKVKNFSYADVLRLMSEKKTLFFIIVNGIHSLTYAEKNKRGRYTLKSASDTSYLNYTTRIPVKTFK
ncbi:hypothetical protein FGM00_04755 [Aggregatimonas sangjinii]|uniref:Uncharacterized protein n=1 Tax=Aggregatimonas sangjinii TaxID=2583587 RepID=A0A5B7SR10_9FLAO|nr:hypothetical protein [Aggregatimonas sangjinii]QCW99452.1 hypothetical protein FGM00_04755 [Aggregatimonas sangjinii]